MKYKIILQEFIQIEDEYLDCIKEVLNYKYLTHIYMVIKQLNYISSLSYLYLFITCTNVNAHKRRISCSLVHFF